MFYFAYGSNMDAIQMKERCPNATLLGVAVLRDHKLAFTIYSPTRKCGCADIIPTQNAVVYGLLYSVSADDMEVMDRYEGHPIHYERIEVEVEDAGTLIKAQSYKVKLKQEGLQPSKHYLGLITAAAKVHGFPSDYIAVLENTATND